MTNLRQRLRDYWGDSLPRWQALAAIVIAVSGPAYGIAADQRATNERQRDRDAASLQACLIRNNGQAALRDALAERDAAIVGLFARFGRPEVGEAFEAEVVGLSAPVEETDRDCNKDGVIDASDYPEETT